MATRKDISMDCRTEKYTIGRLFVEMNSIDLSPEYQREGNAWGREKKELFLDSLFNGYDVPKLYIHKLKKNGGKIRPYALVDGKQRLQCIWDFLEGKIALGEDFKLGDDPIKSQNKPLPIKGELYGQLSEFWKEQFKAIALDVVIISEADVEDIEEIFSRLNNGEPLNAAEKRNAIGGNMCALIRKATEHKFFKEIVPIANKRYQHRDLTARFLLIEDLIVSGGEAYCDLKKRHLDDLAVKHKKAEDKKINQLEGRVNAQLDSLIKIFAKKDPLLKKAGSVQLYYLFLKEMEKNYANEKLYSNIKEFLQNFAVKRRESLDIEPGRKNDNEEYAYLDEFERLTQQSNDRNSLKRRVSTLKRFFLQAFPDTRIKDAQRNFSDDERYVIYILGGKKCASCGDPFASFEDFEADHVMQWSHGGKTKLGNARALCRKCNRQSNKKVE